MPRVFNFFYSKSQLLEAIILTILAVRPRINISKQADNVDATYVVGLIPTETNKPPLTIMLIN